jgi:hypothetical protein
VKKPKPKSGRPANDASGRQKRLTLSLAPRTLAWLERIGDGSAYRGAKIVIEKAESASA